MSLSIEALIIAVFAILPGFGSAAVRATLKPQQSPSAGEWVAGSVVASLFLNAIAFLLFSLLFRSIYLDQPLSVLGGQLLAQSGWTALGYLTFLYLLALVWGLISGFAGEKFEPRVLAYRLRLTPISPRPTVFTDVLTDLLGSAENRARRGQPDQEVAWLRMHRDGKLILGRIGNTSVNFGTGDPIEVYLSPGYVFAGGMVIEAYGRGADVRQRGLYLRLRAEDIADILVAPASWTPVPGPPAAAPSPAPTTVP
ncbi:DUF6338 family protein [Microbacteriaceae bacterium K1510]|nr:DUF6338 family protein [Microbacteriaceae bacterium K1510]